jgi:nitrile hydratase
MMSGLPSKPDPGRLAPNHDHDHGHDHDHDHGGMTELAEQDLRVRALESALVAKGLIDPKAVDAIIEAYESRIGPHRGAQVVARAWTEPDYLAWLRRDATAAIGSMGFTGRQGEHLTVVENTPRLHHLVVCTLCSCYPWSVLGLPPAWYKSPQYRARAVREPRAVLAEMGFVVPAEVQIRVWDSTAEMRYLVLPERPGGTEAWPAERLARLVTRDAMVGAGALRPLESPEP